MDCPAIPIADRAAIAKELAALTLTGEQAANVIAMLSDKIENESNPVRDVVAYASGLAARARRGKLDVPQHILDRREDAEIRSQKVEIEIQKTEIRTAIADGRQILLDGEPVAGIAENGKYIIFPNGDYLHIAPAILGGRVEILP